MTLTIIFGVLGLIGVILLVLGSKSYSDGLQASGWVLIICCAVALIINTICWIPSNKDSVIKYNQLIQERVSIESMLETDKNVDRVMLNNMVIDYNNRIIEIKENHDRLIYKDYYNQNLDWDSLKVIEWK